MTNKRLATLLLSAITAGSTYAAMPDSVYIQAYSNGNTKEGIKIDYSVDQHTWTNIGNNYSFVKSDYGAWGAHKNMFTPSMICVSGKFYAVWAISSSDNQFATTMTDDLWLWKPQDYPYIVKESGIRVSSVLAPVLSYAAGKFTVTFRDNEGNTYSTVSSDFKNWSAARPVPASTHAAVQKSVMRVPYSVVSNLITQTEAARFRMAQEGENMRDDAAKFAKVSDIRYAVKADIANSKPISPELFGIFFEDINYAADGGLYAELVQNRDFEYNAADRGNWNAQTAWRLEGEGTEWTIATDNPIHANNSHYSVLNTTKPGARLINEGWDGIAVTKGSKYDLSAFISGSGKVRVSLVSDGKAIASATLSASASWKQSKAVLTPSVTADKAQLVIEPLQAGTLKLDFVSLFPKKTYKNRPNGMRPDLAQTLADLRPQFVRFPGGCASHGQGINNIYHWQATVGDLWERQHDMNIWNYHQTRGIGFYEYFQFCEDIGAQPLPVLAAGVPCQNSIRGGNGQQGGLPWQADLERQAKAEGKTVEQVAPYFYMGKPLTMESYLQELLDLIEWANGDAKTSALARIRAKAGHPKPFGLKYLGIGNEDLISDVFLDRYNYLVNAVKKAHPEITIVGTVGPFWEGSDYEFGWADAKATGKDIVDEHYYNPVGWYLNHQDYYDKYDRNGTKVYLGEWASKGNHLENALAEAIHVTNFERNADVVTMSSYAPLLAKEGHTQWNPDLIYFNNTEVKPTPNYYVQAFSGQNAGDEYVYADSEVTLKRDGRDTSSADVSKRIASSIVRDKETGDVIVKLVNAMPQATSAQIAIKGMAGYMPEATVQYISDSSAAVRNVAPQTETVTISPDNFTYEMRPYSFSVIRIKKAKTKK